MIDHIKTHIYIRDITLKRDQRNNINEFSQKLKGGGWEEKGNYNIKLIVVHEKKNYANQKEIYKKAGCKCIEMSSSK